MNRKLLIVLIASWFLLPLSIEAQNVAINTTGAVGAASAMLDVNSTNSGVLIPRVALTATNVAAPVTTPATSLLVYNTATAGAGLTAVVPSFYYWDGTQWVKLQSGNTDDWTLLGNAGTLPSNNFIGTTDNQGFQVRTNNTDRVRVEADGDVGIATTAPNANSILEIVSTTKGILIPRMTLVQRNAIVAPPQGLIVYNTTEECINWWDNTNAIWNSACCPVSVLTISANANCYNVAANIVNSTNPNADCFVIKINAGVTLGGCAGGGCGGAALDFSGVGSGKTFTVFNNGVIRGKGGDGGAGSRESDAVCAGDIGPSAGQCGGDAILGATGVKITVINTGTIAGGGGGAGGGGYGCCSAGGGGGGGAGIPAGIGGVGRCWTCVSGFTCGCSRTGCSAAGANGSPLAGGAGGGNGNTGAGTACPGTCTSAGAGAGGAGGGPGAAGAAGANAGAGGGVAGAALRGFGTGCSISGGTVNGAVIP
jgi:hypothetical protein